MEDDDEFGDLYTDVLRPFSSSSAFPSNQQPAQSEPSPAPIGSAADTDAGALRSDAAPCVPSSLNPGFHLMLDLNKNPNLNLNLSPSAPTLDPNLNSPRVAQDPSLAGTREFAGVSADSSSESPRVVAPETRVLEGCELNLNIEIKALEQDRKLDQAAASMEGETVNKDENLVIRVQEEDDDGPSIPGISSTPPKANAEVSNFIGQEEADAQVQGDDWESDSEDDLQIVLNDNHHYQGPTSMDGIAGKIDDNDEDEDGDPLVILDDSVAAHHQPQEEQGWGEDASQARDGERKETGESGKTNGVVSLCPKIGYGNHGHHPFHSQFKYVRPGASTLPGGPGQVHPPAGMGAVGGRGRGEWRPPGIKGASMQKTGFWGGNVSGRGLGVDFTLPSYKSIFDVDINSFEEKPWNYPGVDIADFFNFDLNEESWKEYCKQLECQRMGSAMKNRAHVHVVGSRPEQEYDPDLPPELAAAAACAQDPSVGNSKFQRADLGQFSTAKEPANMRPSLPTGRAIQVETVSSERLPSADTRPPRPRDIDAIIEIVLQDSLDDDSSAVCEVAGQPNDSSREDIRDISAEEDGEQMRSGSSDGSQQFFDSRKGDDGARRSPQVNKQHIKAPRAEPSLPPEPPTMHLPGPRRKSPVYPSEKFEVSNEERRMKLEAHGRPRSKSPGRVAHGRSTDDRQEEPSESMEAKDSLGGVSTEEVVVSDDEPFQTEGDYVKEKGNADPSADVPSPTSDTSNLHSMRKLKLGSHAERTATKENDDMDYLKAAKSSDNSRATDSQDRQKVRDVVDDEVIQDEHSSHAKYLKRNLGEDGPSHRRKDHDGGLEVEKNMLAKGREGSYSRRDRDPYPPQSSHVKSEGLDRRKERDYADGMLQQRDGDPHSRKIRSDNSRKHDEDADRMVPRHGGKVREGERSNNDERIPPRKLSENGSWRGYNEKDLGLHMREKGDTLKSTYENVNDPHSKRRKDDEQARRGNYEKDEILRAPRESSSGRKRERDECLDHRKRDEQHRREIADDHRSLRLKGEGWLQRERTERLRERDDWHHPKQSYEDSLPRREREDVRAAIRGGRVVEDKGWVGKSRNVEYKGYERESSRKDTGRNDEKPKRKDIAEGASSLQHRGTEDARKDQYGYEVKKVRQDKSNVRSDHAVDALDDRRAHEREPKENSRRAKESEVGQRSTTNPSKKSQDKSGRNEMAGVTSTGEQDKAEHRISARLRITEQNMEDASSDDEQHRSKRGRSKLERWASHEERDYSTKNKPSSSLKVDAVKDKNPGAGHSAKVTDETGKKSQALNGSSHSAAESNEGRMAEEKEADAKPVENDKHLDTVTKLKKRSERFKLPMPSEKDTATIKKMESEPLPSTSNEVTEKSEMKKERPPRKRRWTSSQAK